MGVKVEFVPTKWSGIIPALLTGKFDVIIGGMGVRPDRNAKVNFTIPYNRTGMSIVASRAKAEGRKSLDEFNSPDVVVTRAAWNHRGQGCPEVHAQGHAAPL